MQKVGAMKNVNFMNNLYKMNFQSSLGFAPFLSLKSPLMVTGFVGNILSGCD
jgi:hypothetical protein